VSSSGFATGVLGSAQGCHKGHGTFTQLLFQRVARCWEKPQRNKLRLRKFSTVMCS
jgi:hypothetical protein